MINSFGDSGPMGFLSKFISGIGNKAEKYDVTKDYLMNGFRGIERDESKKSKFKKEMMKAVQDYVIINPKNSEYNSSKIFLSKKMLLSYLTGTYKEFFKTENFQRQYSYELPNILWRFERRKQLGDYVLLFPNPDYRKDYSKKADKPTSIKDNWISASKARRTIEHLLDVQLDFPQRRKFIDSLKAAYEEAFRSLEDYNTDNIIVQKKSKKKKKKEKQWVKKKNEENKNKRKQNIAGGGQGDANGNAGAPGPIQNQEKEKLNGEKEKKINSGSPQKNSPKDSDRNELEEEEEEYEEEEEEDKERDKRTRKLLFGGGFYERKEVEIQGQTIVTWVRTTNKTRDFTTLLRQVIYCLIASQGLVTREFVSDDGAYIVLVIHSPEQNLKKIAQKMQLSKQLDLTLTDLMSLEPIDNRFRPFRTNEVLWNEIKWFKKYGKDTKVRIKSTSGIAGSQMNNLEVKNLRENIKNMIQNSIQFKRIVRDLHGIWDRNDDLNNIEGTVYEHDDISLEAWKDYYLYLTILDHKVRIVRQFHRDVLKQVARVGTQDKEIVVNDNKLKRRLDKYRITKILSVLYRNAMLDSLNEVNDHIKKRAQSDKVKGVKSSRSLKDSYLRNIWNAMKVHPFEANMDFILATNKNRPRIRQFLKVIWKEYYHPNGESTHFTEIERLKCVNWLTNKILDLNHISETHKYIYDRIPGYSDFEKQIQDNFFPLHNPKLLNNGKIDEIFEELFDGKEFFEYEKPHEVNVRAKFKQKVDPNSIAWNKDDKKNSKKNNQGQPFKFNNKEGNTGSPPKLLNNQSNDGGNSLGLQKKLKTGKLQGVLQKNAMKIMLANKAFKVPSQINQIIDNKDKINQMFQDKKSKLNDPLSYYEKIIYNSLNDEKPTHHLNLITTYKDDGNGENNYKSLTKKMLKNHLPMIQWPLDKGYKISIFRPWVLSIRTLRAYFGEKIALFIKFYSFYLSSMLPMVMIGVPLSMIGIVRTFFQTLSILKFIETITNYLLAYGIVIWSGVIVLLWERKERLFALKYGQIDSIEEEKIRKNFKGVYVRSIVDDFMNDKSQSNGTLVLKMIANYLIAIFFLGISTGFSILILYFKHKSYENRTMPIIDLFELNQLVYNTIDCIKGFIIDGIYIFCLKRLIVWENHKFIKDHEKSLVNLSFFFILFNTCIPYILILFIQELGMNITCIDTCFTEGSIYFTTFVVYLFGVNMLLFSIYFVKKVPKALPINIPGLKNKKNEIQKKLTLKENDDETQLLGNQQFDEEKMKELTKKVLQNEDMIYRRVNKEVMKQVNLNVYNSNEDFDGLILLYIEIVLNFALVTITGVTFPLAFAISYCGLMIKYIALRNQMLTSNRRPDPEESGDIGHFKEVMKLINTIGIFANSLSLSAGADGIETRDRILIFLLNLFAMIAINFSLPFMLSKESETVKILKKRQDFVTNKISQSLNKTANTVSKTIKIQPNFFIYGKPELHKKDKYGGKSKND